MRLPAWGGAKEATWRGSGDGSYALPFPDFVSARACREPRQRDFEDYNVVPYLCVPICSLFLSILSFDLPLFHLLLDGAWISPEKVAWASTEMDSNGDASMERVGLGRCGRQVRAVGGGVVCGADYRGRRRACGVHRSRPSCCARAADENDPPLLAWWYRERRSDCGGLRGRARHSRFVVKKSSASRGVVDESAGAQAEGVDAVLYGVGAGRLAFVGEEDTRTDLSAGDWGRIAIRGCGRSVPGAASYPFPVDRALWGRSCERESASGLCWWRGSELHPLSLLDCGRDVLLEYEDHEDGRQLLLIAKDRESAALGRDVCCSRMKMRPLSLVEHRCSGGGSSRTAVPHPRLERVIVSVLRRAARPRRIFGTFFGAVRQAHPRLERVIVSVLRGAARLRRIFGSFFGAVRQAMNGSPQRFFTYDHVRRSVYGGKGWLSLPLLRRVLSAASPTPSPKYCDLTPRASALCHFSANATTIPLIGNVLAPSAAVSTCLPSPSTVFTPTRPIAAAGASGSSTGSGGGGGSGGSSGNTKTGRRWGCTDMCRGGDGGDAGGGVATLL
ncbi:hypothetical protein C8R45DRAFT_1077350 [Mycena sanguinolenta]|nr:hypothetical protein C8R45DRAFT_1077350 [Mycena sanguinolenta]